MSRVRALRHQISGVNYQTSVVRQLCLTDRRHRAPSVGQRFPRPSAVTCAPSTGQRFPRPSAVTCAPSTGQRCRRASAVTCAPSTGQRCRRASGAGRCRDLPSPPAAGCGAELPPRRRRHRAVADAAPRRLRAPQRRTRLGTARHRSGADPGAARPAAVRPTDGRKTRRARRTRGVDGKPTVMSSRAARSTLSRLSLRRRCRVQS